MAEAHQAVAFNLTITHEGVHINYDEEVLALVFQSGLRSYKKRFARFVNNFKNGVYPSSLEFLAFILVIVTTAKFAFGLDTSCGFIDWFDSRIVTPFISPRFGWGPLSSTLVSCIVFGNIVWLAKAMAMRYTLKLLFMYKGWMYGRGGSATPLQKLWIGLIKVLTYKNPMLYSYQASLPRLPLPSLHDTLTRYLRSVKPLESEEDYQRLVKEAEEFENGIGRKLQRYLWLKSWWSSNYVSDWWEEYVYLRGRQPIMVNSNYYAIDAVCIRHTDKQASRAANLVYAGMMFRRLIDRQELRPIMLQNLVPLCSGQYERIFNTTRIPGIEGDRIHHLDDSQHIVVYHNGKYYKMDVYYKSKLLLPRELEKMLEKIIEDTTTPTEGEKYLGALTAADRVTWAEARQTYFMKGINRISLSAIENAAFVLILDDDDFHGTIDSEDGLSSNGRSLLHGKGYDRWFDKSFNLIVSKNGRAGFNGEHSWADAPVMGHFWEFVLSYEAQTLGYNEDGRVAVGNGVEPPSPLKLKWDIPDELVTTVMKCRDTAQALLNDVDLKVVVFKDFGKGFIKTCGVSPDAFVQLAFQLAYYRGCGRLCLTYEASMTRLFREGRTETVRPVTIESAEFVRVMNDPSKTNEERKAVMSKASAIHTKGYQDAMCGKGIDRHLFCLYVISKYLEVDSPFLKEILSEPWRLSTSQTPHGQANLIDLRKNPEYISAGGGFGPVADDGYGVSYIIAGEDTIFFHISSKRSSPETDSSRFAQILRQALNDMRSIFTQK